MSRGMGSHHLVRFDSACDDFSLLHFLTEVLGLLFWSPPSLSTSVIGLALLWGLAIMRGETKRGSLRLDGWRSTEERKGPLSAGIWLAFKTTTKDCHIAVIEKTRNHRSALSILKLSSDCWK